jgi:hypothetical protein
VPLAIDLFLADFIIIECIFNYSQTEKKIDRLESKQLESFIEQLALPGARCCVQDN